jgi:LysM repeat protein
MSPDITSKSTKLCPTCGTRVTEDALRCLVCGTILSTQENTDKTAKTVQGSRIPSVTLSLPLILLLLLGFLGIGAGLVYLALQQTGQVVELPTSTPTSTQTATSTITPTSPPPTATETPAPTATPQSYTVQGGDTCLTIAFTFGISVPSIVLLNDLPASCELVEGQKLLIPQPTPTATPPPTATMNAAESTRAACGEFEYTIQDNDTLSSISLNYNIPIVAIKEYNGLVSDTVRAGVTIKLPLCQRNATPGPTPTATPPPPYPAANLLLPVDGAVFSAASGAVTLQWAAPGTLRENESYAVTILDVTGGVEQKIVEYVNDTRYIIPNSFLATLPPPVIIRWWVLTVRQTGTGDDGNPIWEPAGEVSPPRNFVWTGGPAPAITPTP